MREAVKGEIEKISPGYDIIFSAQKNFSHQTLTFIRVHIENLLAKANLYE